MNFLWRVDGREMGNAIRCGFFFWPFCNSLEFGSGLVESIGLAVGRLVICANIIKATLRFILVRKELTYGILRLYKHRRYLNISLFQHVLVSR